LSNRLGSGNAWQAAQYVRASLSPSEPCTGPQAANIEASGRTAAPSERHCRVTMLASIVGPRSRDSLGELRGSPSSSFVTPRPAQPCRGSNRLVDLIPRRCERLPY